jgi:hypothetical protein
MAIFHLKRGDTLPILEVVLKNPDGSVHDLTGSSSWKLHIRLSDGTELVRDMTKQGLDTAGTLRYTWVATDWDAPVGAPATVGGLVAGPPLPLARGVVEHRMEYEVLGPSGGRLTFPNGGDMASQAYDTLRIWDDIGNG